MNKIVMHPLWQRALGELKRSIYADQVFCSVASEMVSMDPFCTFAPFHHIHKLCWNTSFYRNSACGHLIRLHFIPRADEKEAAVLTRQVVYCLYQARYFDGQAGDSFDQIQTNEETGREWIDLAMGWQRERRTWLNRTAKTIRILVPEEIWKSGKEGAQPSVASV